MSYKKLASNVIEITIKEKKILLIGTAHILDESVQEVKHWIEQWQPDVIYVELCEARYKAMTSKDRWKNLDIVSVIKSGQGFLMLASLFLTALQKKMGGKIGGEVGEDMLSAIRLAEEKHIPFVLADRDLNTTLRRAWRLASFKDKVKIIEIFLESVFETEEISKEEVKQLLGEGNLYNTMMSELAKSLPAVKRVLLDERNLYMARKVFLGPGNRVLLVIGRGHLEGVVEAIENPSSFLSDDSLDIVPKGQLNGGWIAWLILFLFGVVVIAGFFKGGTGLALSMVRDWILVTGTAAALGCVVVLAHPVTILSSWIIAPLTTLNPFVGAGMFLALIEAFFHKPRVKDFENLPHDIITFRGFWKNRITKILLVFVTSSLGASIGTFVGIPWISRLLK